MQFIDLEKQQERIRPQIDSAIKRVLDHGHYIMGPEIAALEAELAAFVNSKHCISCASGTDALLLGLMAYGIGPGDAIFTSPFTFFATAEVIALTGATPVFVDIDPETYNIDPAKIITAVARIKREGTLRPRGIIPVDLFGLPADYDAIMPFAEEQGLFVLQDAAQAFGAVYKGRTCPSLGHIGAASFFPAKPLGCYGDGGAVFTDDDKLAEIMQSIRVHGKGTDKYNNVRIGLNARMDTIQAAIVLEKLKIYPEEIESRQRIAREYGDRIPNIKKQSIPAGYKSVWAQFCVESDRRAEVQAALNEQNIPSMIYYVKPLHLLAAFSHLGYRAGDFPAAEAASEHIFALPFHPYLQTHDIEKICDVILSC